MTQFGLLKTKIEKKLLESYTNQDKFKSELKNFRKNVLENKTIAKLYWLYDELKNKKNVDSTIVNDYVNESINIYNYLNSKIEKKGLNKIDSWVSDVVCENIYNDIDNLFSTDVMKIEEKIKSKKSIIESLKKKEVKSSEQINLPISTMVNIANKTINSYIEKLNESDKNKLIKFLSTDENKMKDEYLQIKEDVIGKLSEIKNSSDAEVSLRIDETINKITNEKFDKLNLFRLKQLNEGI